MDRKQQLMALVNSEYPLTPLVPWCLLIYSLSNFYVIYCLFLQDFIDYKIQIFIRISNIVKDVEDHELYLCTPLEVLVHFHNVSLIKPSQKSFLLLYTYEFPAWATGQNMKRKASTAEGYKTTSKSRIKTSMYFGNLKVYRSTENYQSWSRALTLEGALINSKSFLSHKRERWRIKKEFRFSVTFSQTQFSYSPQIKYTASVFVIDIST